jgi:hypothetical protein
MVLEDAPLKEKLNKLKEKQADYQAKLKQVQESGEDQLSLTDKDARLLSKRGESTAGYNAQIAVDEQHKLLVCCEVTQDGNDLQLPKTEELRLKPHKLHNNGDIHAFFTLNRHYCIFCCTHKNCSLLLLSVENFAGWRYFHSL